ncbi:unnamed protein product [Rotaria sp. Silwood1]|nr:unnamed protein product [Rotaria sp. Silwood1]
MYANKRAAMAAHCTEHLEQQCTLDGDNNQSKNKQKEMMMTSNQPPPFAKLSIKRIMVQGVACPNGRP